MFRIYLCKSIHFTVSQRSSHFFCNPVQVTNLIFTQCQTFLFVIRCNVFNIDNRIRLFIDGKNLLIQSIIQSLQHRVEFGMLILYLKKFFHPANTFNPHILGNLNSIRTPWS